MVKMLLLFAFFFSALVSFAQDVQEDHLESVWQVGKEFYFSNTSAGKILVLRGDEGVETVAEEVGKVLGLTGHENVLYAAVNRADGGHVLAFDLSTRALRSDVAIPEAKQLNDIAIDRKGTVYVTDRLGDKVYAVNVGEGTFRTLVDGGIKTPNGICVDESLNRLLICNTIEESSIYSYNLESGELLKWLATGKPHLDGLARDNSGNIYVTSWSLDWKRSEFIRFGPNFEEEVIWESENGMADFFLFPGGMSAVIANWYTAHLSILQWEGGVALEYNLKMD